MSAPEDRKPLEAAVRRLAAMGIAVRLLPGGRTAVGALRLGPEPLVGAQRGVSAPVVRFAVVGADRIKCLEPTFLFHLPLIPIGGCADAAALEAKIRAVWNARMTAVRRVQDSLGRLGVTSNLEAAGAVVSFAIGDEDGRSRARAIEPGRVILPSRGPLSSITLAAGADRVFETDPTLAASVDLEISITNRLEQLARAAVRRAEMLRTEALREADPMDRAQRRHLTRLLLVGPRLVGHAALAEALRVRGYDVCTAAGADDALAAFGRRSFELVFADAALGRDEGLELVPALHSLAGIARLPVVLVDDQLRPQRREAARRAGAVGYLVHPLELSRIAAGLRRLTSTPQRRFARYARRLAVRCGETGPRGYTSAIGRMGMLLCTNVEHPLHSVDAYQFVLPELGVRLRVDAETVYRVSMAEGTTPAVGLRFRSFPDADESLWIRWLSEVQSH